MRESHALAAVVAPQARPVLRAYSAREVPLEGTMLYWLKQAATDLRKDADRKHVHIAASMDADQSTIYRFENEDGWPELADLTIAAYAHDLDVSPIEIWERALALWKESGAVAGVRELQEHKKQRAANRAKAASAKARRGSRERRRESDAAPQAKENENR